jgi:hypothetical protein
MGTIQGSLVTMCGPAPGATRPAQGSVSILRGTTVVTEVETRDGSFTRKVPAGSYALTAQHGGAPCQPAAVTVTAGAVALVQVVCDVP